MLTSAEHKERMEALIRLLEELSGKQLGLFEEVDCCLARLDELYRDDFRHSYSEISELVRRLALQDASDPNSEPGVDLTCLQENLNTIEEVLSEGVINKYTNCDELASKLRKLVDHVHLSEIQTRDARAISDSRRTAERISEGVAKQKEELGKVNAKLGELERLANTVDVNTKVKLDEAKQLADNIHGQTIAVLGIFSAIVLAFNGGIAFSSSSIGPLASSELFSICFVISIVGLFLFNLLFALLTFVYRMVHPGAPLWCILDKGPYLVVNLAIAGLILLLGVATCCAEPIMDAIRAGLWLAEDTGAPVETCLGRLDGLLARAARDGNK